MSIEIDWALLTGSTSSSGSLSEHLVSALNAHLASATRPSFVGTISVAAFSFGSSGPTVEIRDIRDVWRAFDEVEEDCEAGADDDSWDGGRATREQSFESIYPNPYRDYSNGTAGMIDPAIEDGDEDEEEELDDNVSVYSGMSPRHGMAALGVGMGFGLAGAGAGFGGSIDPRFIPPSARHFGGNNASRSRIGTGHGRAASLNYPRRRSSLAQSHMLFSPPLSTRPLPLPQAQPLHRRPPERSAAAHGTSPSSIPPEPSSPTRLPGHTTLSSDTDSSGVPSLQLHLHISHTSDLTLTLLTSLQVNYPSSLFMSLPLKLCVTGLALELDFVLAYAGAGSRAAPGRSRSKAEGSDKGKVHLSIVDEDPNAATPIGQRIIPNVQIESEIGDGDVHVLRNVGKVERFIVDALRKTIVDELVFPNFQTVVL